MKNKVLLLLAVLPFFFTILLLRMVPDEIPMHYDFSGNINRWGSKFELLLFPVFIAVFQVFWVLLLSSFARKRLASCDEKLIAGSLQNEKVLFYTAIGTWILFTGLHFYIMISSILIVRDNLETQMFSFGNILILLMGIFMIVIGNIMPKTKRNSVIGLRTRWSMSNDEIWSKSNRFGGYTMVVVGVLVVIVAFVFYKPWSSMIMLLLLIIATIVMIAYSKHVYDKFVSIKERSKKF